jgi:curved DNA-binding protein CbpA
VDALGRPSWDVTGAEVSKAYRRLSILVHPDKNPGDDARQAFEALNEAHRLLKDANKLVRGQKVYAHWDWASWTALAQ